nr:high mobility group B protein 6-like isoform X1 [Ipomoea batatas]
MAEQRRLLPTCLTASSSASEVVEFFRISAWLMDLTVDHKALTDRENALKTEKENCKKAKESVIEFGNWKMRVNGEIQELKETRKTEVEERLEVSERRSDLLDKRVALIEENSSYIAVRLAADENVGKSTVSDLNLKPQEDGSGAWVDQNEMRLALVNDPQLCMSALCALYRDLISAPLSNDQFGVELAKYLINGHPENKLNRPMSEIPEIVAEESIWLALKYSEQLFRIYSNDDPKVSAVTRSAPLKAMADVAAADAIPAKKGKSRKALKNMKASSSEANIMAASVSDAPDAIIPAGESAEKENHEGLCQKNSKKEAKKQTEESSSFEKEILEMQEKLQQLKIEI